MHDLGLLFDIEITWTNCCSNLSPVPSVMAAGIFIFLTQFLKTNQIATGLAMTIFGIGLSSLLGKSYVGVTIEKIPSIPIPLLYSCLPRTFFFIQNTSRHDS